MFKGKGVKEDLSQITKSFTPQLWGSQQLWGMASFLAPPPPERSSSVSEETASTSQEHFLRGSSNDETTTTSRSRGEVEDMEGLIRRGIDTIARERTLGDALQGESDSRVTSTPRKLVDEGSTPTTPKGGPRLMGLRSDFAELRESVATGLSRISNSVIRAVAGDSEDDEDDEPATRSAADNVRTPRSSEDIDQATESLSRRFDSFFKPLLGNMLVRDGNEGDASSENDDDGANSREVQEQTDPKPRASDSLPSTFASGIDGISKFLLQIVQDEEDDEKEEDLDDRPDAVGLNDGVVTFAKNIAMHPETWLDFPLPEDENEDEFVMNNVQKAHAEALEIAAPGLKALRIELCPNYMSEGRFWLNYFVLLQSRLSSEEAQLLSTSQVLSARASLVRELQKKGGQSGDQAGSKDLDPAQRLLHGEIELDAVEGQALDAKKEVENLVAEPKEVVGMGSIPIDAPLPMPSHLQKWGSLNQILSEPDVVSRAPKAAEVTSVAAESSQAESGVRRFPMLNLEDDEAEVDEWLDDEPSTKGDAGLSGQKEADLGNMDEDVSFSDFEDDDPSQKLVGFRESGSSLDRGAVNSNTAPETKRIVNSPVREEKGDGSQTRNSDKGDSDDWLTVDQDDVVSTSSSP